MGNFVQASNSDIMNKFAKYVKSYRTASTIFTFGQEVYDKTHEQCVFALLTFGLHVCCHANLLPLPTSSCCLYCSLHNSL